MIFKNKISISDLANTYVGVINYIYNQFNLELDAVNLYSFLLDLYCILYFGTFNKLEKILTQEQIKELENNVVTSLLKDNVLDKINLENVKDFNWSFFSQENGAINFLQYKFKQLNISLDNDKLYFYSFTILNNLNATNSYLKTVKVKFNNSFFISKYINYDKLYKKLKIILIVLLFIEIILLPFAL